VSDSVPKQVKLTSDAKLRTISAEIWSERISLTTVVRPLSPFSFDSSADIDTVSKVLHDCTAVGINALELAFFLGQEVAVDASEELRHELQSVLRKWADVLNRIRQMRRDKTKEGESEEPL